MASYQVISQASDTVSMDLLTSEDLRRLQAENGMQPTISSDNKKIYLILTYSVAFDRFDCRFLYPTMLIPTFSVQYPLPLTLSNQYPKSPQRSQPEATNPFASLLPTIQYEIHSLRDDQKRHLKEIARVSSFSPLRLAKINSSPKRMNDSRQKLSEKTRMLKISSGESRDYLAIHKSLRFTN
jgi:hypothetical protein